MKHAISRDAAGPGISVEPSESEVDGRLLNLFLARGGVSAESAFRRIVERHAESVLRVCRRIVRDHHGAQDAAQAVFLVLARNAGSIRRPDSLGAWLHGVALRIARRARDGEDRRRRAEEQARIERGTRRPAFDFEAYQELHEELASLPDRYRLPLVLCYLEGYTQEEAASVLGWPYGTLQTRLHRGRKRLREAMARRNPALLGAFVTFLQRPGELSNPPDPSWAAETTRVAVAFARSRLVESVSPAAAGLACAELGIAGGSHLAPVLGLIAVCLAVAGLRYARSPTRLDVPSRAITAHDASNNSPNPAAPIPILAPAALARSASSPPSLRPNAPANSTPQADLNEQPRGRTRPEPPGQPAARAYGRELFSRVWVVNDPRSHGGDGLGPVFNGRSCVECHDQGGPGGGGLASKNIEIATVGGPQELPGGYFYSFSMDFGGEGFHYRFGFDPGSTRVTPSAGERSAAAAVHPGFVDSPSVVLHRFGVEPSYLAWRGSVPGRHGALVVQMSQRNPTPLFGAGLIESIPDDAILAGARRRGPGTGGRVGRVEGGRIGRFGWKAQASTLDDFVRSAASGEMGLQVPGRLQADDPRLPGGNSPGLDMDEEECIALTRFVRALPRPVAFLPDVEKEATDVQEGARTFRTIGCVNCHVPKLGDVDGLYSDLLLHDMGPGLSDDGGYTVFGSGPALAPVVRARSGERVPRTGEREWRTPPLWGLRHSAPYLHDGRATTIREAVTLHGGQAAASAERFARLPSRRRRQLETFLMSLVAPGKIVD